MLKQVRMKMTMTASTPMVKIIIKLFLEPVSNEAGRKEGKAFLYMFLNGSLLFLRTQTRPDITFRRVL